jgi:DNA-binding transcriptional regulator YhcF (GntR family)
MNAYDHLKDLNIIETRRGLGFFVAEAGRQAAMALRRSTFIEDEIPRFKRSLDLLNISLDELNQLLNATPPTQTS